MHIIGVADTAIIAATRRDIMIKARRSHLDAEGETEMICGFCFGRGFKIENFNAVPCEVCYGSGTTYCCDGICEQPREAALRPEFETSKQDEPYTGERTEKMKSVMRTLIFAIAVIAGARAAEAAMTCADYADSTKAYSWCKTNQDTFGQVNCCAGAVAWKVACDVFHVLADDHAAASKLAYSTAKGRRAVEADMKECTTR